MVADLVAEYAPDFPGDELVIIRHAPMECEVLIRIPRAAIARAEKNGSPPPFWRHGETMNIRPAGEAVVGAGRAGEP